MIGEHPIKQLLFDTQAHWNHNGTPEHVRDTFWKIITCGTIALGAEVYATEIESKLVFHTCKSRFCTSCGQRATEAWQEDLEAVLPDIPYVGLTFTLPMEFRTILQENRHLLHGIPAMGAEALQQWANARHGVRLIINVVQQTFGGFLNFVPHLHIMVSAGGLQESRGRWIHRLQYDPHELMLAWRYAVGSFLSEAYKKGVLRSSLSSEEFAPVGNSTSTHMEHLYQQIGFKSLLAQARWTIHTTTTGCSTPPCEEGHGSRRVHGKGYAK